MSKVNRSKVEFAHQRGAIQGAAAAVVVVLLLALPFIQTGCAHRNASDTGAPKVTPYEQVMAWNAALASSNEAVAKGIVQLNAAKKADGTPVVNVKDANRILTIQFEVAKYDKQVTEILAQGPAYAKVHAAELDQALGKIHGLATTLVNDPELGITDAGNRTGVKVAVDTVFTMTEFVVQGLHQAGVFQ